MATTHKREFADKLTGLLLEGIKEAERTEQDDAWAKEIALDPMRHSEAASTFRSEDEAYEAICWWWGADGIETAAGEQESIEAVKQFAIAGCSQRELEATFEAWRKSGLSPDTVRPYLAKGDFGPMDVKAFAQQGVSPDDAPEVGGRTRWLDRANALLGGDKHMIAEGLRAAYLEGRRDALEAMGRDSNT